MSVGSELDCWMPLVPPPTLLKGCLSNTLYLFYTDSPRFMGVGSELDCWMTWIDNSMADAAFDTAITDDFDDFIGGE